MAHVFATPMFPQETGNLPAGTCFVVKPGAFSDSLRRIRAGHAEFDLRLDHRRKDVLARYGDGCLSLWVEGGRLIVRVHNRGAAGRLAVSVIRCAGNRRELSIGAYLREWRRVAPSVVLATRGDLYEVSVVQSGACAGARLWL